MAFSYHNITGSTGVHVELLTAGDNASTIKSISLANIHASADATVSLSIAKLSDYSSKNTEEVYYLIKTISNSTVL